MGNTFSQGLSEDVMRLILRRLHLPDYFRCRAVCRSWLATIDRAMASGCCPPSQFPCLMFRSLGCKDHCFLSPSEGNRVYKCPDSAYDMNKLKCVGSIEGWLIMVDHAGSTVENFFLNPVSGAKVMLPSQTTIPGSRDVEQASFSKVVASSAPTNPNSCLVAGICPQAWALAFCRPTDKTWTLIEANWNVFSALKDVHDIEILDGKLYAIATTGQGTRKHLYVFDIDLDSTNFNDDGPHHTYKAEKLVTPSKWPDLECRRDWSFKHTEQDGGCVNYPSFSVQKFYLFKDCASNELLTISVTVSDRGSASNGFLIFSHVDDTNFVTPTDRWDNETEAFQVFKLQHNSSGPEWVEVFDLGDRILFLSKTTKLFIPISNYQYGLPHDKSTLGVNHIYFAFGRSKRHDLGMFSLTDNSIQHYTVSEDHSPRRDTPPSWFTPSL